MKTDATAVREKAGIDILEVEPRSDADQTCIDEIKRVLKKHNALDRFGICLLHEHFPMGADEILVEYCDPIARVLTLQPKKKREISVEDVVETAWRLDTERALIACGPKQLC